MGALIIADKKFTLWRRGCVQASCARVSRQVLVGVFLGVSSVLLSITSLACAQNPDGDAASKRLIQERPNDYRGGKDVGSMGVAKQNMKELFKNILIDGPGDGKAD